MILRGTKSNNSVLAPSSGPSPNHASSSPRGAEAAANPDLEVQPDENGQPSKLEDHFGFLHSVSEKDQMHTL